MTRGTVVKLVDNEYYKEFQAIEELRDAVDYRGTDIVGFIRLFDKLTKEDWFKLSDTAKDWVAMSIYFITKGKPVIGEEDGIKGPR